jgi:hypothetical protein
MERALIAQRIAAEQAGRPGKKLAREVLDDLMFLCLGMAAKYQPLPAGVVAMNGQQPDEAKFIEYAKLAGGFAAELAPYQSPKFKGIIQLPEMPVGSMDVHHGDSQGAGNRLTPQEAYRLLRDSDVIDVAPAAQLVGGKKIGKKAAGG